MAWLDRDPSGYFHVCFRLGERKFKRSLRTKNERAANGSCLRLEENVRLVESGRLEIPPAADIPAFLLSDGKLSGRPEIPKSTTLGKLFIEYCDSLPVDSLEANTLRVAKIHMRHIERFFGVRFAVERLSQQELQNYVGYRSRQTGHRGKPLSATTIKKELSTFSTPLSRLAKASKRPARKPARAPRRPEARQRKRSANCSSKQEDDGTPGCQRELAVVRNPTP